MAEHGTPGSEQQDGVPRVRVFPAAYAEVVPRVREGGGGRTVRAVVISGWHEAGCEEDVWVSYGVFE